MPATSNDAPGAVVSPALSETEHTDDLACTDRRAVIRALGAATMGLPGSVLAVARHAIDREKRGRPDGNTKSTAVVRDCEAVGSGQARHTLPSSQRHCLVAVPAHADLTAAMAPPTPVWGYGGQVPGPVLRRPQGSRAQIELRNQLPVATTVHWHGLRVANAMDGVPWLTQKPVAPGLSFTYDLNFPDAGTYWYHPHLGTPEQLGRGLSGVLIVDETHPPAVDRELVWLLDDWRLTRNGEIRDDFYRRHDLAHAGRIGNTVTINGAIPDTETVRTGERIRLRLINGANARIFALQFEHHQPWVMALDGQALAQPEQLGPDQRLYLAPGQRADLYLDCNQPRHTRWRIIDRFNRRQSYELIAMRYRHAGLGNARRHDRPPPLASNPVRQPRSDGREIPIRLDGGAGPNVSVPTQPSAHRVPARQADQRADLPAIWGLNGAAHLSHGADHPFAFSAARGESIRLHFDNQTNWWHPMHLHGHVFVELSRDGAPLAQPRWRDTALIAPRQTLTVAFVADNPGNWLLHCHVLEHHAAGMGMQFRVRA